MAEDTNIVEGAAGGEPQPPQQPQQAPQAPQPYQQRERGRGPGGPGRGRRRPEGDSFEGQGGEELVEKVVFINRSA